MNVLCFNKMSREALGLESVQTLTQLCGEVVMVCLYLRGFCSDWAIFMCQLQCGVCREVDTFLGTIQEIYKSCKSMVQWSIT